MCQFIKSVAFGDYLISSYSTMARTRRSSAKPPGSPRSKMQNVSPITKNLPKKKNRVHSPSKKKQRQQRRCNMQAPSPNLQTRSKRKESGVSYAMNTVESTRIAKIIADFKDEENKPCSCFGADREERYRDYFFCHQCLLADRQEQNSLTFSPIENLNVDCSNVKQNTKALSIPRTDWK